MRAFLFPYDPSRGILLCQMVDPFLPRWEGVLKGVGGKVEAGETPTQAIQRELQEELGEWGYNTPPIEDWVLLTNNEHYVSMAVAMDITEPVWRAYAQATRESIPICISIGKINEYPWAYPDMGAEILKGLRP